MKYTIDWFWTCIPACF